MALFADNGAELSAPAFFTLYFPTRQMRSYADDGRILSLDYAAPDRRYRYEDPALVPERGWRDVYQYDAEGQLLGWTRHRDDKTSRFTRHGKLVLEVDAEGRPLRAASVAYPVINRGDGQLAVQETITEEVFLYGYDGPADRLGYLDAAP